MKTLAVIPARGGSKSIPRKNLADVAGRPLIAWVIGAAREAKRLDRVIVSTEDEEIAETARRYGAEVPFVRPAELATDTVSLIPVVQHALAAMDGLGFRADAVMSLQATSPGLRGSDAPLVEFGACFSHATRQRKTSGSQKLPRCTTHPSQMRWKGRQVTQEDEPEPVSNLAFGNGYFGPMCARGAPFRRPLE